MEAHHIEKKVRFLERYAFATTAVMVVLGLAAFRQAPPAEQSAQKVRFTEIDVERINVLEPDGRYRMVISNRPRSIGPIFRGEPFGYPGGTRPGIIFFNDEGTENGGLTFSGRRDADGSFRSVLHLSFDQYEQDQVLYLQYNDTDGRRRMGLHVVDRADVSIFDWVQRRDSINRLPDGPAKTEALQRLMGPVDGQPLVAPRMFAGRDVAKNAVVSLGDASGRTRLRLVVDSLGGAGIEFLDASGAVTRRIGPE